jgi:hypothetical protein
VGEGYRVKVIGYRVKVIGYRVKVIGYRVLLFIACSGEKNIHNTSTNNPKTLKSVSESSVNMRS